MESQTKLYKRLKELSEVVRYSDSQRDEVEVLAYSIDEIAGSCRKVISMYEAMLGEPLSKEQLSELTHELREELGHLVYHVHDSKFLWPVAARFIGA